METGTIIQIIALVIVLVLAALGIVFTVWKSKKNTLVKLVGIVFFLAMALTWIFNYGYFNGAEYMKYEMNQQGLTDISNIIYYALQMAADKLIFLFALAAFYGVLSKCKGYSKIVNKIADAFKGSEVIFVVIMSLFITLMTTFFTQTFIVLIFVPFIISILLAMKLDKVTAFSATFGSILVASLGLTYGGEGLYWFNNYAGTTLKTAMLYRVIVLVVAFILFNFFNVMHVRKITKKNKEKENEVIEDPFKVEEIKKDDKKVHIWPTIVIFAILFIILILGYIDWNANFDITIFQDFHTKLMEFTLGDIPLLNKIMAPVVKEFAIVSVFLGSLAREAWFGSWNLFHGSVLLMVFTVIFGLIGRIKLDDFLTDVGEGIKKFSKPIALFFGIYMVMTAAYMSPFIPGITNTIVKGLHSFNPYVTSFIAFISSLFHTDFGFTGYIVASYFTTAYPEKINAIHTVFTTINGFSNLFIPTSALLAIGLSYIKLEYKTWLKYIWMFLVAMLVILMILFTVMTYI